MVQHAVLRDMVSAINSVLDGNLQGNSPEI